MTPGCSLFSESSVQLTGSEEIYEEFNKKNSGFSSSIHVPQVHVYTILTLFSP